MVNKYSPHYRGNICRSLANTPPTFPSRCRSSPPDNDQRSDMPVKCTCIGTYPYAHCDMSADEHRAEDKSRRRNINLRHTIRHLSPDLPSATLYNRTSVPEIIPRCTTTGLCSRQEDSPSVSSISLPSFQESFPEELCDTPQQTRSRPTDTSAPPPALSVLNLPTATFAWPRIEPASKMLLKPRLYMDLDVRRSFTQMLSPDRSNDSENDHTLTAQAPNATHLSCYERWTPSADDVEMESCSLAGDNIQSDSRAGMASSTQPRDIFPLYHPERENSSQARPGVLKTPRSKRARISKNEHGSSYRTPPMAKDDWQKLSQETKDTDGVTYYVCLGEKDGVRCTYWALKQAMKRHVEATHLHIKRHSCSYCPKAYSQKTALQVHEATHTGARPLECYYKCGKMFSDPARRHKHYVNTHGYIPKQPNKKLRIVQSCLGRKKELRRGSQ